jgi:hypothetical protein
MALSRQAIERYAARIGVDLEWCEVRSSALAIGAHDLRMSVRRGANEGWFLRIYGGYDAPFVTVKAFCDASDLARLGVSIATQWEARAERRSSRALARWRVEYDRRLAEQARLASAHKCEACA